MDIGTVFISLASSIAVVWVGKYLDNVKESIEKRQRVRYLVTRLVIIFENYAIFIKDCMVNDCNATDESEAFSVLQKALSEAPQLFDSPDYLLLGENLLVPVLNHRHQTNLACDYLMDQLGYLDSEEVYEEF